MLIPANTFGLGICSSLVCFSLSFLFFSLPGFGRPTPCSLTPATDRPWTPEVFTNLRAASCTSLNSLDHDFSTPRISLIFQSFDRCTTLDPSPIANSLHHHGFSLLPAGATWTRQFWTAVTNHRAAGGYRCWSLNFCLCL